MSKIILSLILGLTLMVGPVHAGSASELLASINPADKFTNPDNLIGDVLSNLLPISITFAGMILVIFIVLGGYQMLTNPTNPQAQEAGKTKITWAIIGFLVVFSAYWIMQIIQVMFGFDVLSGSSQRPGSSSFSQEPVCRGDVCSRDGSTTCYCSSGQVTCSSGSGNDFYACCGGVFSLVACN